MLKLITGAISLTTHLDVIPVLAVLGALGLLVYLVLRGSVATLVAKVFPEVLAIRVGGLVLALACGAGILFDIHHRLAMVPQLQAQVAAEQQQIADQKKQTTYVSDQLSAQQDVDARQKQQQVVIQLHDQRVQAAAVSGPDSPADQSSKDTVKALMENVTQ